MTQRAWVASTSSSDHSTGGGVVVEAGEAVFGVGDDGRPGLACRSGECELVAEERDGVRVAEMVDELADGPAGFPVGGVELVVIEAGDGVAQLLGELGEGGDGFGALGGGRRARWAGREGPMG